VIPDPILEQWLAGEDVAVVAPTLPPATLSGADRRVLLITADATSALLLAVAIGAPLLLRTTGTKHRSRTVSGPAPIVVTALDDLHVPSYRALLQGPLKSWPRVLWGGEAFAQMGRSAHLGELVGPALTVFAGVSGAPEGSAVLDLPAGVVRGAQSLGSDLVALGGGVLLGGRPEGATLGGLNLRRHRLDRPFHRAWVGVERALSRSRTGIEVLDSPVSTVTAGGLAVATHAGGPLFVPESSVVLVAPPRESAGTWHERAQALRDGLRSAGDESWVLGDAADPALLGDLVQLGVLRDVRPVWTSARISDAERFGNPLEDEQPAWRDLAERYAAALPTWSAEQRAALALSDPEPRDLPGLAEALGVLPSMVCDVLMDLDAARLIQARVEGLAFEGRPGPRFHDDLASIEAPVREVSAWWAEDGCRTSAFRLAAGLGAGEDCGACEHCDPSGQILAARSTRATPGVNAPTSAPDGDSPNELHSELSADSGPAIPGRAKAEELSAVVERAPDEEVHAAVAEAGGPVSMLVSCVFRFQGPERGAALPDGIAQRMLAMLLVGTAPWGALPEGVTEARPGTWTVPVEGAAGTWSFVRRRGGTAAVPGLLKRLLSLYPDDEGLSGLAAARAARGEWETVISALEPAVQLVLQRAPGALDRAALLAPVLTATAALEAAVGQSATFSLDLVHVLAADPAALEPYVRGFVGRAEPQLHHRVAARAAALSESLPVLSAGELARWWARDKESLGERTLMEKIGALTKARRGDIAALLDVVPPGARKTVVETGLALGALPRELLPEVLDGADVARAAAGLVAATPAAGRARRLWREQREALDGFEFSELRDALSTIEGKVAACFVELIDTDLAERAARAKQRVAIVELADSGRLGEAAQRLAALPNDPLDASMQAALDGVKARAIARQGELVAPVAAALAGATGNEAEDAAFAAIEDSIAEGFGRALVALLSKQHRRAQNDPARALWLARALCLSGDWAEGQRVYGLAASMRSDINARIATEFEGLFLAFEEGEVARGLRWLQSLLEMPWHQVLLPHLTGLIDEGLVPDDARSALAGILESTGSPFYGEVVGKLRA